MTYVIDSRDMTQGNATNFTLDRFKNKISALALNGYSLTIIDDLNQEEIFELMNHNKTTSKHFYLIEVLYDQVRLARSSKI